MTPRPAPPLRTAARLAAPGLALALALAGCSKPGASTGAEPAASPAPPPPPPAQTLAEAGAAAPASPAVPVGPTAPQLAYSYEVRLEAPAARVPALLARHEAACRAAGPAVCQLLGSDRSTRDDGSLGAELTLRAEPGWLQRFRDGLAADARGAGGRVAATKTSTEDVTRSLVDTEAALRAKTVLADRLEGILASRPGKVSELLEVEQALATARGEIDAARSELAVMRTRVATSELKLAYDSRPGAADAGVWHPVTDAGRGAAGVFAWSVAALILGAAALLPFALVGAAVVWLLRARRRRRPTRMEPDA